MPSNKRSASSTGSSPYESLAGAGSSGNLSWAQVEPALLRQAIAVVVGRGDAVVVSSTSDGGALSLRVLSDKQVHKWYPASMDELHALLRELASI